MKKTLLLLVPIIAGFVITSLINENRVQKYHKDGVETILSSINPPTGRTGAPGEGNCTSCHSGATMSAVGLVTMTLDGGPDYIPGTIYPITFTTPGGPKNGFQLTILDADNNQSGSFIAGPNTSVATSGDRQYVRHAASLGVETWTFDWQAPMDESGVLTAYFSIAKANNNGNTSGDEIFLGSQDILPDSEVGIADYEKYSDFKVYFNAVSNQLNLNYSIKNRDKVVLNIQDLSGKLVEYFDFGAEDTGQYTKSINLTEAYNNGVYIVALFVGNKVYNQKIVFSK